MGPYTFSPGDMRAVGGSAPAKAESCCVMELTLEGARTEHRDEVKSEGETQAGGGGDWDQGGTGRGGKKGWDLGHLEGRSSRVSG